MYYKLQSYILVNLKVLCLGGLESLGSERFPVSFDLCERLVTLSFVEKGGF